MNYIKAQIEAKQSTLSIMLANIKLFGGQREVDRKSAILEFEIYQLMKKLDAWH